MNPENYYKQELHNKQQQTATLGKKVTLLSRLRLLVGTMLVLALYFAIKDGLQQYWLITIGCLVLFLFFVRKHNWLNEEITLLGNNIKLIEDELNALNGDYSSFKSGKEYIDPSHPYSYDLDIFGDRSIYQMLCRTVTHNASRLLARQLQGPYVSSDEIVDKQLAIQELSLKVEFLQKFRATGSSQKEAEGDREKILSWFGMEDRFINRKWLFWVSVIVPVLSVLFIALSLIQQTFHNGLLVVLVANWIILRMNWEPIKEVHLLVARSVKLIDKYEMLLNIVSDESFENAQLKKICETAVKSVVQLAQFRKLVHLFDSRQNGMVGPIVNSFFLFDIYCVLKLEQWRSKHRDLVYEAFEEVDRMDVYISMAIHAFNNPKHCYPVINSQDSIITAKDLKHPLIAGHEAVGNDVSLGKNEQFYLLTGANMTGKSTFIRTVSVNVVMAYLGLPVKAAELSVPLVKLYSAIRISDSIQDDVSYFKAELNRLQKIMDTMKNAGIPYLILLDEPLRGTNSSDKQAGTRAVIEKLIARNALGIVATHDTGLCDLETIHQGKVSNYHFESAVNGNQLTFDYKLKKGCSTSNNATVLMKLMEII